MSKQNPFKYFKTSPEVIKLAIWYYIRFPLSLRNVEDILHERGIDICHETVRFWWNRFGPIFAKKLWNRRTGKHSLWRWHIDEVFVKISGQQHYLWRAIDHEGTVLECVVTKRRDRRAAFNTLKKLLSKYGSPHEIVTDKLRSYRAALREIGYSGTHETGQYKNNQCENSHLIFEGENGLGASSGQWGRCKNSHPSSHNSTTISNIKGILKLDKHLRNFAINRLAIGRISVLYELALSSKQRPVRISLTAPPLEVLPPSKPKYNGGIERANRTFREDFYDEPKILADSIGALRFGLKKAVMNYNSYRPHSALHGQTPIEYLQINQAKAA